MLGSTRRLCLGPRNLRHRPQPVQDTPRQAYRARELLVDVDRIEVSRRARIAHGQVPVGRNSDLGDLASWPKLGHRAHTPLTMFVHIPRQTSSPRWLVETDSNT